MATVPIASIDFETRGTVDLKKVGVDRYAEHPDTGVWCMAWAIGDGDVHVWQPGEPDPAPLLEHITRGGTITAWNAPFESAIWRYVIAEICPHWPQVPLEQWSCTMARALALALPGALEKCAVALKLPLAKDMAGHRHMLKMCRPTTAWKKNPVGPPQWHDTPEDRARLAAYCAQDVRVERAIMARVAPLIPSERRLWILDQKVNRRGVQIDLPSVAAAADLAARETRVLNRELEKVTGGLVKRASNAAALLKWVNARGLKLPDLRKRTVAVALAEEIPDPAIRRALEIRQQVGKASTAKLKAMLACVNSDGRARGLLGYHVATTGRWAGRRIQPQNMPRPTLKQTEIEQVIELLRHPAAADCIRYGYADPIEAVASSLRAMIIPAPGKVLLGGDFANIEGRVLAWLAGEEWKLEAFRAYDAGTGHDLYRLAYARSFGAEPGSVNDDQRQVGKVQELALGYQGGPGAFISMGLNYNIDVSKIAKAVRAVTSTDAWEDALWKYPGASNASSFGLSAFNWTGLRVVVDAWRRAHPKIKHFWHDLEDCAINAVQTKGEVFHTQTGLIKFAFNGSFLFCQLPSGRCLAYARPRIASVPKKFGKGTKLQLQYYGQGKKSKKWELRKAYGGLLAENVTQATARDILAAAMFRVDPQWPIVLHVHDEIVCEAPPDANAREFEALLCTPEKWAAGLPIAAKAWVATRYQK